MNTRYRVIILIIGILLLWKLFEFYGLYFKTNEAAVDNQEVVEKLISDIPQKVKVTVYYESLCSDSRNFIIKHLLPTYTALSNYMTLDLVPYGKAKTIESNDGKLQFTCQHTATECLGNKIHACVIDQITDPMLQLKVVSCMIDDGLIPFEAAERCSHDHGIDYEALVECANDIHSSLLLKGYGERTNNVQPAITFIPTIELNGSQKVPLPRILKDFKNEFCKLFQKLPGECL